MFGYVSFAAMSAAIRSGIHKVPADVELVVGIPRSGMIPAYQIGLILNRHVIDLESFLAGGRLGHGSTRRVGVEVAEPLQSRHILLVDDSLSSGRSMRDCVQRLSNSAFSGRITTCAAIVEPSRHDCVDLSFLQMAHPRIFEWNAMHHVCVENSCFDLDGVLCVDPTDHDNDDGVRYEKFLLTACPLYKPTQRIGHIVSARLEKYRPQTEQWLEQHRIKYGALHLLDLPSHAERRRLNAHSPHKARIYEQTGAALFYESDPVQAQEIATMAGKSVLCMATMEMALPQGFQLKSSLQTAQWRAKHPLGRLKSRIRSGVQWALAPAKSR